MNIILAGGGGAADSRPLDEVLVSWLGIRGRLLYWPMALRGIRTFDSCLAWITSTFAPLGLTRIDMWTELAGHRERELEDFDAVYIGGGNTYALLAELRDSHFDRYLQHFVAQGKPVYGGSAGAVILGRDINTVRHMDQNLVRLTDTTGLDLAQGYAVWPHYTPQDDEHLHEFLQDHTFPVLALTEQAGVVIEGGQIRSAGFEAALRFDVNGKSHLPD